MSWEGRKRTSGVKRIVAAAAVLAGLALGAQQAQAIQILYTFEGDAHPTATDQLTDDGSQNGTMTGLPANQFVDNTPGNAAFGTASMRDLNLNVQRLTLPGSAILGEMFTISTFIAIDDFNGGANSNNKRVFSSYNGGAGIGALALQYGFSGGNQNIHILLNSVSMTHTLSGADPLFHLNNTGNVTNSVDVGYNMLTLTYNDGLVNIYLDGALVDTGVYGSGPVTLNQDMTLGNDPLIGGTSEQVAGWFDDVLVYDRDLTAAEVAFLFANGGDAFIESQQAPPAVPEPGTVVLLGAAALMLVARRRAA